MIRILGIKIHLLFILPCILLWLAVGPVITVAYLFALFCHEASHVAMARALGFKQTEISLSYYGCKGEIEGLDCCELSSELPIAAAGPLFSLICAMVFALLSQVLYFWYYPLMGFAGANLILGCFNLLPALPLDGGRILRSILCAFLPRAKGTKVCITISVALGVGFLTAFAYYATYRQYRVFLAVIGIFLIVGAIGEKRNLYRYRIGTFDHGKKLHIRPQRVRRVAVSCEEDLRAAMSLFKNDCFNVVDIVTEDGKVQRTVTEIELMNKLTGGNDGY